MRAVQWDTIEYLYPTGDGYSCGRCRDVPAAQPECYAGPMAVHHHGEIFADVLGRIGREELDDDRLKDLFVEAGDRIADVEFPGLLERIHGSVAFERAERLGFQARLCARWERPLELMEGELGFLRDCASWHSETASRISGGVMDDRGRILERLNGRALRTFGEVVALLKAGYADGAHARCRTLDELAIVMDVLLHADDKTLQRYLDHAAVSKLKQTEATVEYADVLGVDSPTESELQSLRDRCDELVVRHGKSFKGSYGWAAHLLAGRSHGLAGLRELAGMQHNSPYYTLACVNVHADPRGLSWSMGFPEDRHGVLTGSSDAGLSLPGQLACISAGQCTVHLLVSPCLQDSPAEHFEAVVQATIVNRFTALCCQAFHDAQIEYEEGRREMLEEQANLDSEASRADVSDENA
jgi:Family of unknown function (DUF5677)